MNEHERIVRDFYGARDRRDWDTVRRLLSPDVVWSESDGNTDYAGDHRGRETVVALLARFVEITGGTFRLEPIEAVCTADHVAVNVRWRAQRGEAHVEGNDLAVYRISDGRISNAWFFPDGFEPEALSKVFSFAGNG